jgi:hypothetical protein
MADSTCVLGRLDRCFLHQPVLQQVRSGLFDWFWRLTNRHLDMLNTVCLWWTGASVIM